MSHQRIISRGSENRRYRSLLSKERYNENLKKENDINKEDSSKSTKRETLREVTYKHTFSTSNNINERKVNYKSFREINFGKGLLSSAKNESIEKIKESNKPTLVTNNFFTELSKEKSPKISNKQINEVDKVENFNNRNDYILKNNYSKVDKIVEVENYFENLYGKDGIKGMTVEFYDLESIKDKSFPIPEWLLKDNSEELFKAELPPQDITVYDLWFFRRKNEGAPSFVHKGIKPISNADILSHLEKIYNGSREEKRLDTNKNGSKMIHIILNDLRKINNYMLYIGSETRYPNNVMEKTPKLIEKLEKVLERIRSYRTYEFVNIANDEKAVKYTKELLDVTLMNFNVRTRDNSKNRKMFRKVWKETNKELEALIEKYFSWKQKGWLTRHFSILIIIFHHSSQNGTNVTNNQNYSMHDNKTLAFHHTHYANSIHINFIYINLNCCS
ncbi:4353_t:CDS:1 [Funneliformis geosporum]|uniref:7447_t:CDS:1 n=1 Tax=Funneliformis geosporum TaxID=1117311 RepID=A0A9W4WPU1_9GLOM|nr:7447_t:CDS:1 [Funneliformis geosporum]CAI2164005.1 4353_t:CDS:1 [Funneliformis geosporum]